MRALNGEELENRQMCDKFMGNSGLWALDGKSAIKVTTHPAVWPSLRAGSGSRLTSKLVHTRNKYYSCPHSELLTVASTKQCNLTRNIELIVSNCDPGRKEFHVHDAQEVHDALNYSTNSFTSTLIRLP